MNWADLLAYATGMINGELRLLATDNRILKNPLKGRVMRL